MFIKNTDLLYFPVFLHIWDKACFFMHMGACKNKTNRKLPGTRGLAARHPAPGARCPAPVCPQRTCHRCNQLQE